MGDTGAVTVRMGAYIAFERSSLSEPARRQIKEALTYPNPAHAKAKNMGYHTTEPRSYCLYRDQNGMIFCSRGAARRIGEIIRENGHEVVWKDERIRFKNTGLKWGKLKPFEEQLPAIDKLLESHQGILRGETGSGKTETMLGAAIKADQPTLVIVWNKDLLKQWYERIVHKYEILTQDQIGLIQGPSNKYGPITLAMVQSLNKRVNQWTHKFGTVIMDECQRAPATTFLKSIEPFPAKHRWGASADERRKDGKEFLSYEVFGYDEWDISKSGRAKPKPVYTIEGAQSLDPQIIIIPTDYTDDDYEEDRNHGQLINRLVKNRERNKLIATDLHRSLKKGRQCILFTERVEAAQWWESVVSSWGFMAGSLIGGAENAEATSNTLQLLKQGKCRFAVTTTYAEAGLDVPSLDTAFVTCPTGSNIKRMHQQVGRIVRPCDGKEEPIAYYYWDRGLTGSSKHLKNIKRKWDKVLQRD